MSGRNHHRRRQERKTKITVTPEEHGMAMAAVMLAIGHEDFAEDLRPENYEKARDVLLYGGVEALDEAKTDVSKGLIRVAYWPLMAIEDALQSAFDQHGEKYGPALAVFSRAADRGDARRARKRGTA